MIDQRDSFYDLLDELTGFNQGWKEFILEKRQKNSASNERLYKLLEVVKGKAFVMDIRKAMKVVGEYSRIRISRKTTGIRMDDKRWSSIPAFWIDVKSGPDGMSGFIYIQVKETRFLKINCHIS